MSGTVPIPGPSAWPLFGNVLDFNRDNPTMTMEEWAQKYGEIYRIMLPWGPLYVVSSQAMVNELCDESRFRKNIGGGLLELQNGVHDGIFTADTNDPQWGLAHRILTPAFGPTSINGMFAEMHEIASQLALKWARHGSETPIMVTDDFTRLTLDTISLCSMGYRFNSYYHDQLHPFVSAMTGFLIESGERFVRPSFMSPFFRSATKKYFQDIALLRKVAQDVLDERKKKPSDRKDLLSAMLNGVDPKTGQKLTDDSIIDNLITFLIAGHETTSGMLSFAFYELIKYPETMKKAREEVDMVIGRGPILLEHMSKLQYISAVLKETLRLCPTIPSVEVAPKGDQVIGGGKYLVPDGSDIILLYSAAHRDPRVHGDTADKFMPERMLDETYKRTNDEYPNFWKPFGNGQRGCIGRGFAMQESILIMAMLLQNFDFKLDDETYELQYLETLTVKPKNFWMRAELRHGLTATDLQRALNNGQQPIQMPNSVSKSLPTLHSKANLRPLNIYYGSNQGTSEALAQRLAMDAATHGYTAAIIEPLNSAKKNLPKDRPVIIITSSYEGEPPDNAASFFAWIKGLNGNELSGISYAVFGCGHRAWTSSFHRVPKAVDEIIETRGGSRICELGNTDVSQSDMFTDFEQWEDNILWPAMEAKYGPVEGVKTAESSLEVTFSTPRASILRQDVKEGVVVNAKLLAASEAAPKRHIEIKLPEGMTYRAGDYLAVLPTNPKESVDKVMRHFGLARDSHITISGDSKTTLPTGVPVPVYEVLGSYVELSQPVTKRGIQTIITHTTSPTAKSHISSLLSNPSLYTSQIITPRTSLLTLLTQDNSIALPFATFLSLLPPIRPRLYSISSSPLHSPTTASLTYSLLSQGVATTYLSTLVSGDRPPISLKQSHVSFHLPASTEVPIIMIAAGSGIAPFRGFIQERAVLQTQGKKLGLAMLFYGCRDNSQGDLYREEMNEFEKKGVVIVKRAYSRQEGRQKEYVGDKVWEEREVVKRLWEEGAKVYVCGSRAVGEGVKKAFARVVLGQGVNEERVKEWFEGVRNLRYAVDVFD
ncbi:putative bifunctional cytochrome P450 E-class, group I:NADPH-P450 reductase [Podospora fimiseda]|uniref:Bifunctional cytochrome P450/NADPH--P450 reductase n=1 Tax=Podospora fimiseda TaxID=252190 RepID=A0AAN6YMV2_9PEZI|nr:putative bifunctional cytochrome P450 E-class, group I:NADPH-P450 reductase [Podospora fimiseda]